MIMTDAGRKTSLTNIVPLTLFVRVRKGCSRFSCERELETEHNWNILTPNLWPSALCLSRSLVAQPEPWGPLYWVMAFFTGSYQHLLWTPNSIGVPGYCFTYHISSTSHSNSTATQLARRTQLSYIIVRRPLNLWNRMLNRHQAEITVMQLRGYSLPVRQSMRVSGEFLACPILLANFRPCDFLS